MVRLLINDHKNLINHIGDTNFDSLTLHKNTFFRFCVSRKNKGAKWYLFTRKTILKKDCR